MNKPDGMNDAEYTRLRNQVIADGGCISRVVEVRAARWPIIGGIVGWHARWLDSAHFAHESVTHADMRMVSS